VIFGTMPGLWSWLGMAMIIGSVFIARRR